MPVNLDRVFTVIGLGTPIYIAIATYTFFRWLDRKGSAQAKRVISQWLKSEPFRNVDLSAAIIGAFDRIYTKPLWQVRAFGRSAAISSVIFFAYLGLAIIEGWRVINWPTFDFTLYITVAFVDVSTNLFAVVASDYVSLFGIRGFLYIGATRPVYMFLQAFVAASLIITIFVIIFDSMEHAFFVEISRYSRFKFLQTRTLPTSIIISMVPAYLVHTWLILFIVGSLGIKALYPIGKAIKRAQWFLRQGNQKPFEAIGLVAAAIVFVVTVLSKILIGVP